MVERAWGLHSRKARLSGVGSQLPRLTEVGKRWYMLVCVFME